MKTLLRPPDKSEYWKYIFLIYRPKHMLWAPKRHVSINWLGPNYNFTLIRFPDLDLCFFGFNLSKLFVFIITKVSVDFFYLSYEDVYIQKVRLLYVPYHTYYQSNYTFYNNHTFHFCSCALPWFWFYGIKDQPLSLVWQQLHLATHHVYL